MHKVFRPQSMVFQLLLLLCAVGLIMILAGAAGGFLLRKSFDETPSVMVSLLNTLAIAKLNETAARDRPALITTIQAQYPEIRLSLVDGAVLQGLRPPNKGGRKGPFLLGDTLFGIELANVAGPSEARRGVPPELFFRLKDGALVKAVWNSAKPPPPPFGANPQVLLTVAFVAVTFVGLMLWAARGVVRPLANLSSAVADYGQTDTKPVPLDVAGPEEVRSAAHAFNRMQERINDFVAKRTETLAAISHDIRTPLTRLRLRLELLDDGEIKDRSLADLSIMDQQITQALSYLKGGAASGPVSVIDLPSLLQSIADQYSDTGWTVKLETEAGVAIKANAADLTRALCNLIDNANHYAGGVELLLQRYGERARIDVTDHGPGMSLDDKKRLLSPFARGDKARQIREGQGFGLGLAISKSIIDACAGTIELLDTDGGGLTVRLHLPLADDNSA